jgi:GTP-binding protein EngB required for normal cell division
MTQRPSGSPAPTAAAPDETAEDVSAAVERALVASSRLLSGERARELARLSERWRARRFVTIVAGEFKRGKSTLLNALAGVDLLPTGVLPVTTVPTRVARGSREAARVLFRDGGEREISLAAIRDYVDESCNPGNRLGVASVEVELATGLPPGVVLVDVPGLGSLHQHNTEAALAALPEADAALVVVSVDPPLGQAELTFLSALRTHAARVDVVLNKVDYLDDAGRKATEAFTRDALARHGLEDVPVWPVSARGGLRARLAGDDVEWRRSGMSALDGSLERFFRHEREGALAGSIAGKAARLVAQELALIEIQIVASNRTSAQLRELVAAFAERRATAERDRSEAVLVFRQRFDLVFAGYAERAALAWRGRRADLDARIAAILRDAAGRPRGGVGKDLQAAARAAANAFVEAFVTSEIARLHADYQRLREEVTRAAAERAEVIWRMAAELLPFEPPRVEPRAAAPIRRPSELQLDSVRVMLEGVEDAVAAFLPRRLALRRLAAQAVEEADGRYGRAVEQTRGSFLRAYEADFRTLVGAFEEVAGETASGVEAALRAAQAKVGEIDRLSQGTGQPEEARRRTLQRLQGALRQVEEGAVSRHRRLGARREA